MSRQPAAFMSYVRFNDQHDDGQLSQFRERLAAEIRVQTGEEFPIFQDRNDIAWGQNWRIRIDETLDAVTLLVVIITPSFFRSPACRGEVKRFLARERELARQDLILPVYYVSTPELDDPQRRDADELAQVLASRQFADWRELRFESFTSPVVRRALAQLASRMRDTFWRQPPTPPSRPGRSRPAATEAVGTEATATEPAGTAQPVAKSEPPTHVVDPFPNRGDYTTIGAAIEAARPGDRILVRPGRYQEGLVVDKPLEILGDGPVADIEVEARGADALMFKASIGRVANLTFRQAGGEGKWFGVDISQGRLELEGCDITSRSLSGVGIRNGADPRLRRNKIHDNKQNGVFIYDSGLGTLEDNDIAANGLSGVEIKHGGDPTLRRNQIHDNKAGVFVNESGLGTLEDNDITANGYAGVQIKLGGNPTLRRNQIHDNKQNGVLVLDSGLGTLEDNDITANGYVGVEVRNDGNPMVRGNRINGNGYEAVWVHKASRGVFEDNDVTGNRRGPWDIADDSKANVKRSGNRE
jgi:parallel beta-helix repeat protein